MNTILRSFLQIWKRNIHPEIFMGPCLECRVGRLRVLGYRNDIHEQDLKVITQKMINAGAGHFSKKIVTPANSWFFFYPKCGWFCSTVQNVHWHGRNRTVPYSTTKFASNSGNFTLLARISSDYFIISSFKLLLTKHFNINESFASVLAVRLQCLRRDLSSHEQGWRKCCRTLRHTIVP